MMVVVVHMEKQAGGVGDDAGYGAWVSASRCGRASTYAVLLKIRWVRMLNLT